MEYLVFIIIAVVVIVSWIRKSSPDASGPQEKPHKGFLDLLGGEKSSDDLDKVRIYDENGNEITFNSNAGTRRKSAKAKTIIYDENGNVLSAVSPSPVRLRKKPEAPPPEAVAEAAEEAAEPKSTAEIYRDFIHGNGGSAIVIQEILSKPVALR